MHIISDCFESTALSNNNNYNQVETFFYINKHVNVCLLLHYNNNNLLHIDAQWALPTIE